MPAVITVKKAVKSLFCIFAAFSVCCSVLPDAALAASAVSDKQIGVTFSVRQYITNSFYFERVSFELDPSAELSNLLEESVSQGYLKEYRFEEGVLVSLSFPNGTSLTAGDYGEQSGFKIYLGGKQYLPFEDMKLRDGKHYSLNYKVNDSTSAALLTLGETPAATEWEWNDSWEATLDSACAWLYYNRTRGSKQVVGALGIAKRSANPTDVVLLTQMVDLDTEDLTDLISTVYALAYCGYSHPTVNGTDLFILIQNFSDPLQCTTKQLCDILRLYDAFDFEVENTVRLSRGAIIEELLERLNDDGGFCPRPWRGSDIEATANVIAVLQDYRDLDAVDTAVLEGISYLSSPEVRDELFDAESETECTAVAQIIIAMCRCRLPIYDVYFTKDGMTYADLLLQYMLVSGGFSMTLGASEDEAATASAVAAMCALQQMGDPYASDMKLVQLVAVTADEGEEEEEIPILSLIRKEETVFPQLKGGFWLACGSVAVALAAEALHYVHSHRAKDSGTEDPDEET